MKLSDIVYRINGNVDRFTTDLEYYIGGEHIDSNELEITGRGILKENLGKLGFKFHFAFQERDVLFMARNPHLRKAGMVMFSGLCSDACYILRSKDENKITQEFLAIQLQSDHFWDYCERTKVGSVNFANNWSSIANYNFELPPIEKQKEISQKVWAAYRLKESYKKLLAATDEMVKSQFIEMFGNKGHYYRPWNELFETKLGKMLDKNKQNPNDNLCPYLANINVQWGTFDMAELNQMTFSDSELQKFALQKGDLLICEGGEAGRCAIWQQSNSNIKFQKAIHRARPKTADINAHFVQYYLFFAKTSGKLVEYITRGTIEHLTGEKLNQLPIPVPELSLQNQFVSILQQADKSKFELRKSISAIDQVIKSIINEKQ